MRSIVLLDIAKMAIENNQPKLAEKLLEFDNPVLLKIQLYLKINKVEKALQSAVESCSTSSLYMTFQKIHDQGLMDENWSGILGRSGSQIVDNFYEFCRIHFGPDSQWLKEIQDPVTYMVQNLRDDIKDQQ